MKQEEKTRQHETLNMNVGDFSNHDCQINQEMDDITDISDRQDRNYGTLS